MSTPIGDNLINEFFSTVGAPPGAAEYWNCGINVPAAFVLIIPRSLIIMFSVATIEAAVTTTAVAAVP